jgi:TfoX N-terminal domain
MAYDATQAERLRRALSGRRAVTEKKMFGGVCFMLRDHMLCGTGWEGFMFRVGEEREPQALARPGATLMEIGGRRMRGFVWVDPKKCKERDLADWVALAEGYVAALPPKKSQQAKK